MDTHPTTGPATGTERGTGTACPAPPPSTAPLPGSTPHSPPGRGHRAWLVAATAALAILVTGSFSTLPGLFTSPLNEELGWSHGSISFAASVNMLLYGLTAPFAAALMDRYGIRRVAMTALVTVATGALLTATVLTEPWQLTLYWGLLVGLGTGSTALAFGATVTQRWFVRRRGLVTGLLASASVLGQMAFLPLLARLVDQYTWRAALVTVALAALVTVPLLRLALHDHPSDLGLKPYGAREFVPKPAPVPGAARRTLRTLRRTSRTGPFWLLAGAFAVCGASTNGILWTHFTPAAHDHGMPATTASSLLALIGVFNVAGTIASGWLTDRGSPRRLLAVYFALRGALLLTLPLILTATTSPSLLAFVVLFGLLDLATVPPVLELCREYYGDDSAIVFGWINTAHQVGAATTALLGGAVRDTFGSYDLVWTATGTLCAAAALMSLAMRAAPRQGRPLPDRRLPDRRLRRQRRGSAPRWRR
ncbi:MFS transporter [Streptomyces sp. NPDC051561]|uniref:MFS transporter n=1 Tax=Streptomyces sp. NPDC051561 TaxID=3365658 RepID=UPI0037992602